tara:strand:- start:6393 stop:6731 length:339 start_codon:yes stop_codon:yes gene_type:complete
MPNVKPAYIVQRIEGKVKHTTAKPKETGGFDYTEKQEPGGYMVYLPNGDSLRVRTDGELQRLGFDSPANLVDMDSGEVVGSMSNMSFQHMTTLLPDAAKETSIVTETLDTGE